MVTSRLSALLRNLFRRGRVERDLDEELRAAVELLVQEKMAAGLGEAAARRAAALEMGGTEQVKEQVRDARIGAALESVFLDMHHAVRALRRTPGFTFVVVATLAIGIAANTAFVSVINGILFKPLAANHPEELVVVTRFDHDRVKNSLSLPDFTDYRDQARSFSDFAGFALDESVLKAGDRAELIYAVQVTDNFFPMLGTRAAVGHLFGTADADGPVMVLSHNYWERAFESDPGVIGTEALFDGQPFTIVGVAPKALVPTFAIVEISAYVRFAASQAFPALMQNRGSYAIHALARLKPGVSVPKAEGELQTIAARLEQQYPQTNRGIGVRVFPEQWSRPEPTSVTVSLVLAGLLMALVTLLSVVVCANVANLALVRMTSRRKEVAIRLALGSSRGRLLRHVVIENLLLAALAGIVALPLSAWLCGLASRGMSGSMGVRFDLSPDWRVITYGIALALANGIVVALIASARRLGPDLSTALHDAELGVTTGRSTQRLQTALAVGQVAIVLTLLVTAGLFVRSATQAARVDVGFDAANVLNVTFDPERLGDTPAQAREFYQRLEERVSATPNVESVSFAGGLPMWTGLPDAVVRPDSTLAEPGTPVAFNRVSPGYFTTVRIPVVQGRPFEARDNESSAPVAVISEAMARRFWPGQDPIGRRFTATGLGENGLQIVGVTKDITDRAIYREPGPFFFVPLEQHFVSRQILHIRSSQAIGVSAEIQRVARELDANIPPLEVAPMSRVIEGGNGRAFPRVAALLAGALGAVGLCVGLLGVYGVVAYALAQRTREFGIRMALGATRAIVLRLALQTAGRVAAFGVLLGILTSFGASRLIGQFLIGVRSFDPAAYLSGCVVVCATILLACLWPAYHASRLQTLSALRHE